MQAAVSPKQENRRGVQYRNEGEDRELTGCREKGKRTVHEFEGCGIMPWLYENRVLVDPDTDGVRRAHDNSDLACIVQASCTQGSGHDFHSGFSNHSRLPEG